MVNRDTQHSFSVPPTRKWLYDYSWRSSAVLTNDKHYMEPIFTKYAPNHVKSIVLKHLNGTVLHDTDLASSNNSKSISTHNTGDNSHTSQVHQYHFRINSFFVHDLHMIQSIHYEPHDLTSPSGQYILNFIMSARNTFYDLGHNKQLVKNLQECIG